MFVAHDDVENASVTLELFVQMIVTPVAVLLAASVIVPLPLKRVVAPDMVAFVSEPILAAVMLMAAPFEIAPPFTVAPPFVTIADAETVARFVAVEAVVALPEIENVGVFVVASCAAVTVPENVGEFEVAIAVFTAPLPFVEVVSAMLLPADTVFRFVRFAAFK